MCPPNVLRPEALCTKIFARGDIANLICMTLSFMQQQQQKASAVGKSDVDLFIARTDTTYHQTQPASQSDSTQLKAGNSKFSSLSQNAFELVKIRLIYSSINCVRYARTDGRTNGRTNRQEA